MKLVNKNGREVVPGMKLHSKRETFTVLDPVGRPPHKPGSTGRIYVNQPGFGDRQFFPDVFDCKWV